MPDPKRRETDHRVKRFSAFAVAVVVEADTADEARQRVALMLVGHDSVRDEPYLLGEGKVL